MLANVAACLIYNKLKTNCRMYVCVGGCMCVCVLPFIHVLCVCASVQLFAARSATKYWSGVYVCELCAVVAVYIKVPRVTFSFVDNINN